MIAYVDGNELRAAELARVHSGLEIRVVPLQTGFSTSAPAPEKRASDKLLAANQVGFAEAADLLTVADGKSLRLDLDSENETRFCRYWRETACSMVLAFAMRNSEGVLKSFTVSCLGQIADKPSGPHILGWERLFYPEGSRRTLADLCAAGELSSLRRDAYLLLVDFFSKS